MIQLEAVLDDPVVMIQLEAVLAAGALTLAAGVGLRIWSWRAQRAARAAAPAAGLDGADAPYVLYFTSRDCTVCRTHQEPALASLQGVRVRKVDALAEPELAQTFRVYTVPTTVVVGPEGGARNVNYGYAPAATLRKQLAAAAPL